MQNTLKVTDALELRPHKLEDAELLFNLVDKNRAYLRQWLPWLDGTLSPDDSRKFIEGCIAEAEKGAGLEFAIWKDNELVGCVGFHKMGNKERIADIGYWLSEDIQGQGIMTEAVKALINYGFKELNLNKIQIGCAVGNDKSCSIPHRLQFKHEGTFRDGEWLYDHYVDINYFGMLKREWKG
jgi:ribosomal-protein-serine acetyltransferase